MVKLFVFVSLSLAVAAGAVNYSPPVVSFPARRGKGTADGPDVLIQSGTVVATAADYQMDGTMWVALTTLDSQTYLYRSNDHGVIWLSQFTLRGVGIMDKLGLVAGEGDSSFVYLFHLEPNNNNDLWLERWDPVGHDLVQVPICYGSDTIHDFSVCRDYSGDNYWLYAVVTTTDTAVSNRATRFLRSSTYGREWYVTDSSRSRATDPHISAGAGSYIYVTCRSPFWPTGPIVAMVNRFWMSQGYWVATSWRPDTLEEINDPVIAAAFTLPESLATIWCLWNQNYRNSGDWDLNYRYSTDGGSSWSATSGLASSVATEWFPDLRNYTSLGNQYINASYISEVGPDRRVYRHYASAANPGVWSDTLRINSGNAGTGSEVRPKLCYSPGGPFSGAGSVFTGAGLQGCWWNAPYPTGAAEPGAAGANDIRLCVNPAVGPGPFRITGAPPGLLHVRDLCGRVVRRLPTATSGEVTWDGRDAAGSLAPAGVYFVRCESATVQAKVILTR